MTFREFDLFIQSAPIWVHFIASALVLAMLSHLTLGLRNVWKNKGRRVRWYLLGSLVFITFIFMAKFSNPGYTMCDAFLPVYVIYYFHSLLVMQARFFNCFKSYNDFLSLFNLPKAKV